MDMRKIKLLFGKFKNIVDKEICLMDEKGYIIDSTNFEKVGEYDTSFGCVNISNKIMTIKDRLYYLINANYGKDFLISISGNKAEDRRLLQIIGLALSENLNDLTLEDFVKGVMVKEFAKDEIEGLCSKFNLKYDSRAKTIVIKVSEEIIDDAEDIIGNMYPEEILIRLNNSTLALIKIINQDQKHDNFEQSIYDTIFSELLYEPDIGVGIIAVNLGQLHNSYEKANLLLKLGKTFSENKKIHRYNDLILPMMIDNLNPLNLKNILLYTDCNIESILMDKELLLTATKFLENNLNVSDTARKLYVHRNTLIYRLNKIENITSLDLRSFKDAFIFNILLNGKRYLNKC